MLWTSSGPSVVPNTGPIPVLGPIPVQYWSLAFGVTVLSRCYGRAAVLLLFPIPVRYRSLVQYPSNTSILPNPGRRLRGVLRSAPSCFNYSLKNIFRDFVFWYARAPLASLVGQYPSGTTWRRGSTFARGRPEKFQTVPVMPRGFKNHQTCFDS